MPSWNQLPTELSIFADQLGKRRETERTAEALYALHEQFKRDWKTHRQLKTPRAGVPVPPPRNQGLHPAGCELSEAFVSFHFHIANDGLLFPDRADFQVRVLGHLDLSGCLVELEDHWRIDTDIFAKPKEAQKRSKDIDDSGAAKPPKEPHPLFHFQRGGHAQDEFVQKAGFVPGRDLPARSADLWRGLLQSPGPRIPFPPMCPILAIDFAIGQHDGQVLRRLRDTPEYLGIVKKAQERLWEPFFQALAQPKSRREWMGALLV